MLRHYALSNIHRSLGIEAAKATGGHADARTTAVYIDPDAMSAEERERARRAALELG